MGGLGFLPRFVGSLARVSLRHTGAGVGWDDVTRDIMVDGRASERLLIWAGGGRGPGLKSGQPLK